MNTEFNCIEDYLNHWDEFFKKWKKKPRGNL